MSTTDPVWLDFLDFAALRNQRYVYFRGHADATYELIPGIGRPDRTPPGGWSQAAERELLLSFKREARRYEPGLGFSDLAWIALAQHHGLPTRLLDWTTNPLTAAWYAVNAKDDADAVVHVIQVDPDDIFDEEDPARPMPGLFTGTTDPFLARVPAVAARITAQQGLFSVHCRPTTPWVPAASGMIHDRFVIPGASKGFFRRALYQVGFERHRLMVDLDGLCSALGWAYINNL